MNILSKKLANALGGVVYFCPACDSLHVIWTAQYGGPEGGPLWQWDGDPLRPTFSPSILTSYGPSRHCHCFIRDGQIQYLDDCHHDLAGRTIELPDLPDWFIEGEYIKPE